jgi:hypothetical protein
MPNMISKHKIYSNSHILSYIFMDITDSCLKICFTQNHASKSKFRFALGQLHGFRHCQLTDSNPFIFAQNMLLMKSADLFSEIVTLKRHRIFHNVNINTKKNNSWLLLKNTTLAGCPISTN